MKEQNSPAWRINTIRVPVGATIKIEHQISFKGKTVFTSTLPIYREYLIVDLLNVADEYYKELNNIMDKKTGRLEERIRILEKKVNGIEIREIDRLD